MAGESAAGAGSDSLTVLEACDLAEAFLLEQLERDVRTVQTGAFQMIAAGAQDVVMPDIATAREEFFVLLQSQTEHLDPAKEDLLQTLGLQR